MSRGALLFLLVLLAGGVCFAGPEFLVRPDRQIARSDLARARRLQRGLWDEAERRLQSGQGKLADDLTQVRVRDQLLDLDREWRLRDLQTGGLLVMVLSSLVFAVAAMPRAVRFRRHLARGVVEVVEDEILPIDDASLSREMTRLVKTKLAAVNAVVPTVAHCPECGTRIDWEVLGQVGKRVLVRRVPGGKPEEAARLGAGWWSRALPPPPCQQCHPAGAAGAAAKPA